MTGFLRKEELHSSLELFLFRAPLLNKIDCRLGDLVERRQGLGIRLVAAFCKNQLGELRGDVHIGLFQRTTTQ